MADIGTNAYYVSSAKYTAVTAWATGVAKTVGNFVRQTAPSLNNERVFICIVAGTTAASEPTWSLSRGNKTTETAGPVWMECTGQPGLNGDFVNSPAWLTIKNQSIALGLTIHDAAGTHIFICTTSGTSGNAAEPTWNTAAVGNTTTDNGATWTYVGTTFNWSAPFARLHEAEAFANTSDVNQYFVGSDHAETQSTGMNMSSGSSSQARGTLGSNQSGPIMITCVDVAGSKPPVTADLATTATVAVTGTSSMALSFGYVRWCRGITFNNQSTLGVSLDLGGGEVKDKFYDNCVFAFTSGTGSGATMMVNSNASSGKTRIRNSTFKFNDVGQILRATGHTIFENCTFNTGAAILTRLFQNMGDSSYTQVIGCDLSAFSVLFYNGGGGENVSMDFVDCKLPAAYTISLFNSITALRITFSRCDNGSVTYQNAVYDRSGQMVTNAAVVRTGGAGDGTTSYSWRIDTTAFAQIPSQPFDTPKIANDNAVTGSTVNVTVFGVVNAAALPTVDDVCGQVQYLGSGSSLQASFKTNRRTDYLQTTTPASLTADSTSAWDTAATARANSHAYSVGDIIAVSSNAGRIFFCTAAGTSAGSLPGGYATAVDGGSVTDSGATFRAGVRFSFTIALSSPAPALAGPIYTTVSFGKISTTYFIDPAVVLS